jgi:adenine phosphoribosyltransferase
VTGGLAPEIDLAVRGLLNPTYPEPWRGFTDLTLLLERNPEAFRAIVEQMLAPCRADRPDAILCVESFGFLFGAPIACELETPLVVTRRAGKLPRRTLRRTYRTTGIGSSSEREMELNADAIGNGMRVLIVDDVLASGRTALAALALVQDAGASTAGVSVAVELSRFGARHRIEDQGIPVHAAVVL